MNKLRRLIKWIWRAWPVIVLGLLICGHIYLLEYLPKRESDINKTISLISQIIGGLIVLYSIDSNIGIIKKINLLGILKNYLKEFPLFTKNVTVNMQAAAHSVSSGHANITVGRNPKSIEEKIDYLQEQIAEVTKKLEDQTKKINEKINKETENLKKQINETKTELGQVKKQIEEVSIGGIKVQFFGVLLIVYGSISGYIA